MKHALFGLQAVCVGAPISIRDRRRARMLRRRSTDAEQRAWEIVRNRALMGFKFRRQQCICGFVVDLYCPRLRLAIELDGPIHDNPEQAQYDEFRDDVIMRAGIRMVRMRNEQVSLESLRAVIEAVLADP